MKKGFNFKEKLIVYTGIMTGYSVALLSVATTKYLIGMTNKNDDIITNIIELGVAIGINSIPIIPIKKEDGTSFCLFEYPISKGTITGTHIATKSYFKRLKREIRKKNNLEDLTDSD